MLCPLEVTSLVIDPNQKLYTEEDTLTFTGTVKYDKIQDYPTEKIDIYFYINGKIWQSYFGIPIEPGGEVTRTSNRWPTKSKYGKCTVKFEVRCDSRTCHCWPSESYDFCVRPTEEHEIDLAISRATNLLGTKRYSLGGKGWDTVLERWAKIDEIKRSKYHFDAFDTKTKQSVPAYNTGLDCSGLVAWSFDTAFTCGDCPEDCENCPPCGIAPQCLGYPTNNPGDKTECALYTPIVKPGNTSDQWNSDPHIYRYFCFKSDNTGEIGWIGKGAVSKLREKLFPPVVDFKVYDPQDIKFGDETGLKPGDLIYFLNPTEHAMEKHNNNYGHLIIYIGQGKVIQSHGSGGVTKDTLYNVISKYCKQASYDDDDWFEFVGLGRFSWNPPNTKPECKCPSKPPAKGSNQAVNSQFAKTAAASYSVQYDESDTAVVGVYIDGDQGHIVNFTPPSEAFTIKKIKIFGAAKIKNTAELKNIVTVRIWDKEGNNQLWSQDVPWSLFLDGTWQDIKVPDISVNDDFQVEVVTHSQAQGDPIDIVSMTGITPVMDVMGANMLRLTGPVQGDVRSAVLIGFDYPQSCLKSPSPSNCPETRSGYSYMGKLIDPGQGRLEGINWLIRVDGEGASGSQTPEPEP
jgi:cell wall-associated NlpC family hydrolase